MSWRALGLTLVALTFAVVGLTSTVILQGMVEEVNLRRSREDRISPFGWYPGKMDSVVESYRQMYPSGRRHIQLRALFVMGAVAFVLGAVCILLPF